MGAFPGHPQGCGMQLGQSGYGSSQVRGQLAHQAVVKPYPLRAAKKSNTIRRLHIYLFIYYKIVHEIQKYKVMQINEN